MKTVCCLLLRAGVGAGMAYRLVKDLNSNAQLDEKQKLKRVRFGSISFEPLTVTDK
jgi:hypothetical protein